MRHTIGSARVALALVAVLCMGFVASPDEPPDEPHVDDPCGDSHIYATVLGERHEVPDQRPEGLDIRAAWFTQELDDASDGGSIQAVHATLELCEEPRWRPNEAYTVRWAVSEECDQRVMIHTVVRVGVLAPSFEVSTPATFSERCLGEDPLTGQERYEPRFEAQLDEEDVSVDGDRITFTLRPERLSAQAAETLRPGVRWTEPRAHASPTLPYVMMSEEDGETHTSVAPWWDFAEGERDFVLGEDG